MIHRLHRVSLGHTSSYCAEQVVEENWVSVTMAENRLSRRNNGAPRRGQIPQRYLRDTVMMNYPEVVLRE